MEHRWGTRHPLDIVVRLNARPHLLAIGRLRDASSSGAYVETPAAPPLMSRIYVELDWGDFRRAEPSRIAAYVVRDDGAGIGLEWCDFAPLPIVALIEDKPERARSESRPTVPAPGTLYLPAHCLPRASHLPSSVVPADRLRAY